MFDKLSLTEEDKCFLQDIFFNLPTAAFVVNSEGIVELINTYACAITEYTQDELLGKSSGILVPERLRAERRKGFEAYLADPHIYVVGECEHEVIYQTKSGLEILVEVAVAPIQHKEKGLLILVLLRRRV